MLLRHGSLGSIHYIVDELLPVWQGRFLAINVTGTLLVHEKKMASAISAGDINILADFHGTVGPQDKESPISPRIETGRRKPVDPNVP